MATRVSYPVELKMKDIEMRLTEYRYRNGKLHCLEQNRDLLGLTDIQCK